MSPVLSVVRVPGKLMIAGEYAVLEPHQPAVVTAVDRFIRVTVTPDTEGKKRIRIPNLGIDGTAWSYGQGKVAFDTPSPQLNFISHAISVVCQFLQVEDFPVPVQLRIDSELNHKSGRKLGLGSSAAVIVGVITALLDVVGSSNALPASRETLYKLGALAHFRAQGSGSGADVAAAVYGGVLRYTAFDAEWLRRCIATDVPVSQVLRELWPYLAISKLVWPASLQLCVGWTKEAASTSELVRRIQAFRSVHEQVYQSFVEQSTRAVEMFVMGLEINDNRLALEGLNRNRAALAELGFVSGTPIETSDLRKLAEIVEYWGGAGKPSGAGGGDCGIGLLLQTQNSKQIYSDWSKAGIEPLDIAIAASGVKVMHPPQES